MTVRARYPTSPSQRAAVRARYPSSSQKETTSGVKRLAMSSPVTLDSTSYLLRLVQAVQPAGSFYLTNDPLDKRPNYRVTHLETYNAIDTKETIPHPLPGQRTKPPGKTDQLTKQNRGARFTAEQIIPSQSTDCDHSTPPNRTSPKKHRPR